MESLETHLLGLILFQNLYLKYNVNCQWETCVSFSELIFKLKIWNETAITIK